MTIRRICAGVRYDGSNYHGWQNQDHLITVQSCIEKALSRVANHPVAVICAGRTDAGVHATAQVIHFDTEADRSDHAWVFGANSNLPHDISLTWVKEVDRDFHARFSAISRRYRYVIFNQPVRPAILHRYISWCHKELDVERMQIAAQHLIGEHDFNAFRGADCQAKTSVRQMHEISVRKQEGLIIIDVFGNAFLLHMVRNIAGVLMEVGSGGEEPDWSKKVLESRDRRQGGVTASANGLYLVEINYPEKFILPKMTGGLSFLA